MPSRGSSSLIVARIPTHKPRLLSTVAKPLEVLMQLCQRAARNVADATDMVAVSVKAFKVLARVIACGRRNLHTRAMGPGWSNAIGPRCCAWSKDIAHNSSDGLGHVVIVKGVGQGRGTCKGKSKSP